MAVRPILLFPNPILSQSCRDVVRFDNRLHHLIRDLTDTLLHSPGVGLAAPQLGIRERISVIDVSRRRPPKKGTAEQKSRGFFVLLNPILLKGEGLQIPREGCLSVPDLLGNVERFQSVVVRTRTVDGGEETITSDGFEALALQHEIDHLNGTLFIDRIANLTTDVFRRKQSPLRQGKDWPYEKKDTESTGRSPSVHA